MKVSMQPIILVEYTLFIFIFIFSAWLSHFLCFISYIISVVASQGLLLK